MESAPRKCERSYEHAAEFRFYEELNDFLPPAQRRQTLPYRFNGHPGIKDPIEAFGVPHTEVDLIVVNGESVGFGYHLQNGDRVAVYPVFEALDITPVVRLREAPLRRLAFVVDVNLGKLARRLRLLGFDTLFSNAYRDPEIVQIAAEQRRIVLTRDRRLLHARAVTHGYWVRAVLPARQLAEVVRRFDLAGHIRPFARCADCNGEIEPVAKQRVLHLLEPGTRRHYDEFFRCSVCGKIYWEGSHVARLRQRLADDLADAGPCAPPSGAAADD